MRIEIGTARVGETDSIVIVGQIGISRIGCGRVTARAATGRFVAVRKLVAITVEPIGIAKLSTPVRVRREAPIARAIAFLTMLVVAARQLTNRLVAAFRNTARAVATLWLRIFSVEYTRHGFIPGHRFAEVAS